MTMQISFAKPALPDGGTFVVSAAEGQDLDGAAAQIDKKTKGALSRAMAVARFTGAKNQTLELIAPPGVDADRVLLIGLGKAANITARSFEALGGTAAARLLTSGEKTVTFAAEPPEKCPVGATEAAARIALGASLRSYRFDKYRTTQKKTDKPTLAKAIVQVEEHGDARKVWRDLEALKDGVTFARNLVSEPPNVLYPETFVREARALEDLGVKIEVLGEKDMEKLGFGALLGVGQGSVRESQLLIMEWRGAADREAPPVLLVGKGVCFDTGGISLKPPAGMDAMKYDMGGAAAVAGAMHALAGRKARANVIGVCGLVENMPDGNAQRPGDVVKSASGQTIEVLNTDAEGRLVLADAIWYAQNRYKPSHIVDLATLTGAIRTALGLTMAGLFSNNDALADALKAAGEAEGERVWRMPMGEEFDKMIDSPIADMKNIGGAFAGSTTAAQFIQRFVNGKPWAHLDIAGTAWAEEATPVQPKGATGWGVRILNHLIAAHHEDK
jgi:leucyl aminopeptidase